MRFDRIREQWTAAQLWVGSHLLAAYAVAGSFVGFEVFAFLAVWPLAIGVLLVALAGSLGVTRRLRRRPEPAR